MLNIIDQFFHDYISTYLFHIVTVNVNRCLDLLYFNYVTFIYLNEAPLRIFFKCNN